MLSKTILRELQKNEIMTNISLVSDKINDDLEEFKEKLINGTIDYTEIYYVLKSIASLYETKEELENKIANIVKEGAEELANV